MPTCSEGVLVLFVDASGYGSLPLPPPSKDLFPTFFIPLCPSLLLFRLPVSSSSVIAEIQ